MIGKCPNCGIELNKPPFNGRSRNEVMIVLTYRSLVESGRLRSFSKNGICEVCNATKEDLIEQRKLLKEETEVLL